MDPIGVSDHWAVAGTAPVRRAIAVSWRACGAWLFGCLTLVGVWRNGGHQTWPVLGASLAALALEAAVRQSERSRWWRLVGLAGAGGCAAVLWILIGRTPAVYVVASVVVADATLVRWRPLPRWPQRRRPVAVLSIGVLLATELAWIRGAPRLATAGGVAIALGITECYARFPRFAEHLEDAVSGFVGRVAHLVSRVILLLVAAPLLYVPGLLVRMARTPSTRGQFHRSSWCRVSVSVADARQDAIRPFASADPILRARRTQRGIAVVLVLALLAALAVRHRSQQERQVALPEVSTEVRPTQPQRSGQTAPPLTPQIFATEMALRYTSLPAYRGSPFADELQKNESEQVVDGNLTTRYRNIENGRRRTLAPPRCRCKRATLWISGGSAAFGTGQRDDHTIASDLVRLAYRKDHIALDVTNVSHDGYTFQLESQWEIAQSLRTEKAPDLLVFYNGWNDAAAQVTDDFLKGPDPNRPLSFIIPAKLQAINADTERFLASDIGPASGRQAATRYLAVQIETDALARSVGTRTAYFFQADALSSAKQLRPAEPLTGLATDRLLRSPLTQALDAMAAGLRGHVTDLRHLFDDDDQSVFLGLVHQNEAGAEAVAERIYRDIGPRIRLMAS